jgi:hypothetical protein
MLETRLVPASGLLAAPPHRGWSRDSRWGRFSSSRQMTALVCRPCALHSASTRPTNDESAIRDRVPPVGPHQPTPQCATGPSVSGVGQSGGAGTMAPGPGRRRSCSRVALQPGMAGSTGVVGRGRSPTTSDVRLPKAVAARRAVDHQGRREHRASWLWIPSPPRGRPLPARSTGGDRCVGVGSGALDRCNGDAPRSPRLQCRPAQEGIVGAQAAEVARPGRRGTATARRELARRSPRLARRVPSRSSP